MTFYIITMILGFAGFIITSIIRQKKQEGQPLVCPINSHCDAVVHSSYSTFFGIDITLFGKCYYGIIVLLYAALLTIPQLVPEFLHSAGFFLSLFAVIFSAYLTIVQFVVIREWCLWCLGSAALSVGILVSTALGFDGLSLLLFQYESGISIALFLATALGMGSVLVSDSFFVYFLQDGRISYSESRVLNSLSQITWFALSIIILAIIGLIIPYSIDFIYYRPDFIILLIVLGVIVVNNVLLNLLVNPKIVDISFGAENYSISHNYDHLKKLSFAFTFVSLVSWIFLCVFLVILNKFGMSSVIPWLAGYGVSIVISVLISQYIEYRSF